MGLSGPHSYKAHHPNAIIERKINVHNKQYLSWLVKLRKVPRNSSCVLTKKNVSAVEHTPIPVVLGSSIAIGQSLSMVVLQRSSGTRSRPVKKESLYHCIFRVGSSVMRFQHCHKMGLLDIFNRQFNSKCNFFSTSSLDSPLLQ